MFTGIVEELGTVDERNHGRFTFGATTVLEDLKIGDSVAVNGCCLTVVEIGEGWWRADAVEETLQRGIVLDHADDLRRALACLEPHVSEGRRVSGAAELAFDDDPVGTRLHKLTLASLPPPCGARRRDHPGESVVSISPTAFARRTASWRELTPSLP